MQVAEVFLDMVFRDNRSNENLQRVSRAIDTAQERANAFSANLQQIGSNMMNFGTQMVHGVSMPILGALKESLFAASDLNEAYNVVDTTFKQSGSEVRKWSKGLLEDFGLVELQAIKYSGAMGAMLKSSGLSEKSAKDMSKGLVELTGDFSSFYNLDHDFAWEKIRSGIAGETEPLKALGINMSVANLEAFALTQGIKKSWKEMGQAEQVTLRYNYLLSQTTDSQGDFAKTADSFSNKLRVVQGKILNLGVTIGNVILPVAEKFINKIDSLSGFIEKLSPKTSKIIVIFGLLVASIAPLIFVGGALASAFGAIVTAVTAVGLPVFAVIAGLGVLGASILAIVKKTYSWEEILNGLKIAFFSVKDVLFKVGDFIRSIFSPSINMLKESFSKINLKPAIEAFEELTKNSDDFITVTKLVIGILAVPLMATIGGIIGILNGLADGFGNISAVFISVVGIISAWMGILVGVFTLDGEKIKKSFFSLVENIRLFFYNSFQAILKYVSGFIGGVIKFFHTLYMKLVGGSIIPDMINGIISWFKRLPGTILNIMIQFSKNIMSQISKLKDWSISKFNSMKKSIINTFKSIGSNIGSVFGKIKGYIQPVINLLSRVKNAASSAISKIKNIKLPKIPDWVPGFAGGVTNFGGGLALVGEKGAELVNLPKGSDVIPNHKVNSYVTKDLSNINPFKKMGGRESSVTNFEIVMNNTITKEADVDKVLTYFMRQLKAKGVNIRNA